MLDSAPPRAEGPKIELGISPAAPVHDFQVSFAFSLWEYRRGGTAIFSLLEAAPTVSEHICG
jgi:hypothetical protein